VTRDVFHCWPDPDSIVNVVVLSWYVTTKPEYQGGRVGVGWAIVCAVDASDVLVGRPWVIDVTQLNAGRV